MRCPGGQRSSTHPLTIALDLWGDRIGGVQVVADLSANGSVMSRFARLWLRGMDVAYGIAASVIGKLKVRLKQIIRILMLNGVSDDVSAQDGW